MKKIFFFFLFLFFCSSVSASTLTNLQTLGTVTYFLDTSDESLTADSSAGSGTATISTTRTGTDISPGTYFNSSGNLVVAEATNNTARYTYGWYDETGWRTTDDYGNVLHGYLAEGTSVNLCTYSETFENGAWVATNMTVDDTDSGSQNIYATSDAHSLTATDANATLIQTLSASSSRYNFSIFIKAKHVTGPVYISMDNGSHLTWVDLSSGGWVRVQTSKYTVTTAPTAYIKIVNSGDSIYVDGAQIESGHGASSYIPVAAGTAQTRNVDKVSAVWTNNRSLSDETMAIQYYNIKAENDTGSFSLTAAYSADFYRAFDKSQLGESWRFIPNSSGGGDEIAIGNNSGRRGISLNVIGVARQATNPESTTEIYTNGVLDGADTTHGQWANGSTAPTNWKIGTSWNAANAGNFIIQKIVVYNSALSSSQVATLSSYLNRSYVDNLKFNKLLVDASNAQNASAMVRIPNQKSSFYAEGRWWAFYGDPTESATNFPWGYVSSRDGVTWTDFVQASSNYDGLDASWTMDFVGNYLHYAKNNSTTESESGFSYRRGLPSEDGTITWSTDEIEILASSEVYNDHEITADTLGHPWTSNFRAESSGDTFIRTSTTTDGTWSMKDGYPYEVASAPSAENRVCSVILPLLDGDMYAVVYHFDTTGTAHKSDGYFYDLSANTWTKESNITDVEVLGNETGLIGTFVGRLTTTSHRGKVYLTYQSTTGDLRWKYRDVDGTWSTEEIYAGTVKFDEVASNRCAYADWVDTNTTPQIVPDDNGDVYFLWDVLAYGDFIRKRNHNGTWDAPVRLVNEVQAQTMTHVQPMRTVGRGVVAFKHITIDNKVYFSGISVKKLAQTM